MDQSKVSNRRPPQFRVFFSLRGFHESSRITRKEECLQDFPAQIRRSFRLVQLLQFAGPVNQPELSDRFATQRFIFFVFRRGKQPLMIAADHVAAKNGVLNRGVATRCVNLGQRFPRFTAAEDPQVFNRFPLQVRIDLTSGDSAQNLARLRRPALRQHEERLRFFPWRAGTVDHFLEQRQRAFGVAAHQPLDGQHFQFIVALVRRLYSLTGRLLHFDLQRGGVFLPAALRKSPLHVRNRGQSRVPLAQAVLCVCLPVERRIRLRAVQIRQLTEFLRGPVVAVVVQVFTTVVVQFLQPFDFFLHAFAGFLFPFALFLFSFPRFLLAFALLLFFVPRLLRVLQGIPRLHGNCFEHTSARDRRRQQQRGDG